MGWNPCCLFSTWWFPCSGGGFSEELRALQPLCDFPPRFLNPLGKHQQVVRPSTECWLDCAVPRPFPQRHFPPSCHHWTPAWLSEVQAAVASVSLELLPREGGNSEGGAAPPGLWRHKGLILFVKAQPLMLSS